MLVRLMLIAISLGLIALILPRILTSLYSRQRIISMQTVPKHPVAIVFGAGLWRDGSPTPVLRDRVSTAVDLYNSGLVDKLLFSGDNRTINYNEPAAMKTYAVNLGIPDDAIVLDYAGHSTYDTCYRARDIFHVTEAILVTQKFHLPRAIYVCNTLGITAIGVPSDLREYRNRSLLFWNLREIPATLVAFWEVHVSKPTPILGVPEPIFPTEAQ